MRARARVCRNRPIQSCAAPDLWPLGATAPACIRDPIRLYRAVRGWRGQAPRQPGQIRKEAAVTSPAWVVVQPLTDDDFGRKPVAPQAKQGFAESVPHLASMRNGDRHALSPLRVFPGSSWRAICQTHPMWSFDACRLNHRERRSQQTAPREDPSALNSWFTRKYSLDPFA